MHVFYRGEALTSHRGLFDQEHTLKSKYSQIKNIPFERILSLILPSLIMSMGLLIGE
jgi:hypothetical protein